jgi:site-specific DNA recombinase
MAMTLTQHGVPTARGANQWQPTAVHRIVTNPAYKGTFVYHQNAGRSGGSRARDRSPLRVRPPEDAIIIPVPEIVDAATWEAAQAQLQENARMAPRNNKRNQYLLRGLIRCPRCGSTYTGYAVRGKFRGYRCNRTDSTTSSTGKRCTPGGIPAQPVEDTVWEAVSEALQQPEVLVPNTSASWRKPLCLSPWRLSANRFRW